MSKTDFELPPLPPDIAALLATERQQPGPSSEAQTRMLGSLCTTLGLPLPVGPGPGRGGGGDGGAAGGGAGFGGAGTAGGHILGQVTATVVKPATLIAFAVGLSVGAGAVAILKRDTSSRPLISSSQTPKPGVTQPLRSAPAAVTATQPSIAPRVRANETAQARAGLKARASSQPARTRPAHTTLAAERSLLEMARTALSRGRAPDALKVLGQHRTQFPASPLAEERGALTVLALVADGSVDEAKIKAARFRARFPKSLLRSVVDEALRNASKQK